MSTAVSLKDVFFSWPDSSRPLFSGVNFDIPRGETTCLIGPNGAGKTTMLELILGWRRVGSGIISLVNRDIRVIPARERGRLMALVPQEERLPFSYTVLEYVLLGRAPHLAPLAVPGEKDTERAMEVLERVGIPALVHRPVPKLSGGEKRLVLIARALVQEPEILLLDEPGNHLDPANRERIISMLSILHDSGITVIMTSHEPGMITRLSRHVVLLKAGEKPLLGASEDMLIPERLQALYGVPVRIADVEGRRIILWGD